LNTAPITTATAAEVEGDAGDGLDLAAKVRARLSAMFGDLPPDDGDGVKYVAIYELSGGPKRSFLRIYDRLKPAAWEDPIGACGEVFGGGDWGAEVVLRAKGKTERIRQSLPHINGPRLNPPNTSHELYLGWGEDDRRAPAAPRPAVGAGGITREDVAEAVGHAVGQLRAEVAESLRDVVAHVRQAAQPLVAPVVAADPVGQTLRLAKELRDFAPKPRALVDVVRDVATIAAIAGPGVKTVVDLVRATKREAGAAEAIKTVGGMVKDAIELGFAALAMRSMPPQQQQQEAQQEGGEA
jgi:hypothetical protein